MICLCCGFDNSVTLKTVCTLTLDTKLLSGNVIGVNSGGNGGWKYRNARNLYSSYLNMHVKSFKVFSPVFLRITRLYKSRKYDKDNLIRGCKPLIDVLVRKKYIKEDNPSHLVVSYNQLKNNVKKEQILLEFASIQNE